MIKRTIIVLLLSVFSIQAQDSAQALARILAEKGLISRGDLAQVEGKEPAEAARMLTRLLYERGVLSEKEVAQILPATTPAPHVVPVSTQPVQAAQGKVETAAPKSPVTVYGTILWNAFSDTSTTNIQDVPLLAGKQGADTLGNDKSFGMTVRQSRLGLRYQGAEIHGARVSAVVEADFFGGKASLPNAISMDLPRLRLAYGRLDWKTFSLVGGQDWSVFAPLNPTTLAEFAIPGLAGSGNPWIRTPQIRAEFRHPTGEKTGWLFQLAGTDPDAGDYAAGFATARTPAIGERGRLPGADSRLAWTGLIGDRQMTIGFSSHYARGKNSGTIGTRNVQTGVDSWGAAMDYNIPLHKRFALTGELFTGRALGIFSASIGQSVLPVGTRGEHGVETRGGWMQAQINLAAKWQANVAYGIDAPETFELRTGDRSRNQTYMGNLMYKFTPQLTMAWEWRRFLTDFYNQRAANERGDHVNLAFAYVF